jgi:beta-fructofuranosidase
MMECPDLFPLGDKWVLIGSLYKTNQWWVGTLSGDPPRFTPERVGILDYGNGYAAKTGSEMIQTGSSRRLVFGFTGWQEPTMPNGCGRALVIPRELRVEGSELMTLPIPETAVLRIPGTATTSSSALAKGSQVEVRMNCSGATSGKVGIRTLATADGKFYTEIGYDFDRKVAYADHSNCCATPNSIVQRAPHPRPAAAGQVQIAIFVDGGLIEAFISGKVITPLVSPDPAAGAPEDRVTTVLQAPGASCSVGSWQLAYNQLDSIVV